jgi:hypothetical protein
MGAVDDSWLCAASSALMVAGDICAPPPGLAAGLALAAAEASLAIWNGSVEPWLKPVDGAEEDFDEVSALRASTAVDAAPNASNMETTPAMPPARLYFSAAKSANRVPSPKPL